MDDNNNNNFDSDEAALKEGIIDSFFATSAIDKKIISPTFEETAMPLADPNNYPKIKNAIAESKKQIDGVELQKKINLIEYTQRPYKDVNLKRFEGAARRNWAVQTSIYVRRFFVFAEKSEIIVELTDEYANDLPESAKQDIIQEIKEKTKDTEHSIDELIRAAIRRDSKHHIERHMSTLYTQCMIFGNGLILKIFKDNDDNKINLDSNNSRNSSSNNNNNDNDNNITKLLNINSRRMGNLIHDRNNDLTLEGVYVDGQPLDLHSAIYAAYQADEISPHTQNYGYTPLECVLNLAEGLNIFYEEDVKEIQRSGWLSSIMLLINTSGLKLPQARKRIKDIIDAIKPGKIIGVGGDGEKGVQAQPLEHKSDLKGLAEIAEHQESKIFKAFRVPQFLVQAEDIANRATADKSAELFLYGVIAPDQEWISDILEDQWYEPFVRNYLGITKDQPLPIKIRRKFKIPTVSEFVDTADALTKLLQAGAWDVEQVNEILKTPGVGDRIESEKLRMEKEEEEENNDMIMNDPNNTPDDKNKNNGKPNSRSRNNSINSPKNPENSKSKKKKEEAYASIASALNI